MLSVHQQNQSTIIYYNSFNQCCQSVNHGRHKASFHNSNVKPHKIVLSGGWGEDFSQSVSYILFLQLNYFLITLYLITDRFTFLKNENKNIKMVLFLQ